MKIRIKQDTPFDKAGSELSISEFKLKYGYICSKYVTDEELRDYLLFCAVQPVGNSPSRWFEVVAPIDELPVDLIIEGVIYRKQLDGFYHGFLPGAEFKPGDGITKMTIEQIRNRFENCAFKNFVWYCTDNVNRKL